ncbi:MAG: DUF3604 domain-containing protein [Sphingomonadales bacterium]|jgi:hypothetical protein|nr:DUF3604 domain-containing protein [Sphingomonadales bacterium]MBK9002438.1 DUF3604 domain-containing protein [Sphingomonadales bacterium]MBK9267668.1 DUF3604 domain-containing protein [Sphingomonadales bacterium]MBP6434915.1 DUF3604 domain-containing protein [Sphingorhabdus sp.]
MASIRKIALGTVAAVAVGAGLYWGWGKFSESREASRYEEIQAANDKEVTSGIATKLLWGDTHLHTSNSIDAFGFGTTLGPEEALRFARGEEVKSTWGLKAKLERPLDFLVIADHSGGLGATQRLYDAPRMMIQDETLLRWHDMMHEGREGRQRATMELINAAGEGKLVGILPREEQAKGTMQIWKSHTRIVERYNEPGKFTAFMGFEYTLMPNGDNLHRVVIMRDGKSRADQVRPYDPMTEGTETVDKLWDYMDAYEKKTGGKMLAIPHNSNVSNGLMFEMVRPGGGAITADYARRRAAREPLVEITQIKGDSESHPFLSPNDEFAGFGDAGWDMGNLTMQRRKTPNMLAGDYVREALKRGLAIEAKTGVNPYKFGLIGSTDSHTSLSTADEDNFFGKHSDGEPNAKRASQAQNLGTNGGRFGWHYMAGGYAGVWATANTRAAIFDAMMRREVYATTGPRMQVRVFGGWDFTDKDWAGDWVKAGYARGVPMGADLKAGTGKPSFLISALKDPEGANLDRVQVVKGWVDASGKMQEKVFDVVWSSPETRKLVGGKLAPVGDTVDIKKATYTNSIGAAELRSVWSDPEFNAGQRAFYYVRVLEIPTPRWVLFDMIRYGAKLLPETELKAQERAYTSPIWYNPTA